MNKVVREDVLAASACSAESVRAGSRGTQNRLKDFAVVDGYLIS